MKKIFTLAFCLSAISFGLLAQNLSNPHCPTSGQRVAKRTQTAPANKIMALNSRLIAILGEEYSGSNWSAYDSSHINYSGTRGGDYFSDLGSDYDNATGYYWDAGQWEADWLSEKTFDGNNRLTGFVEKYWDGSAWENNLRTSVAYDGAGRITTWANQQWDGSIWLNTTKDEYTYDANGNLLLHTTLEGDTTLWRPESQITRTYNANNQIISELHEIEAAGWLPTKRYTWEYDGNNLDSMFYEGYTSGPNTWEFYNRTSYTYNTSNQLLTRNKERTVAGVWRNDSLDIYTYNAQGHLTSRELQIYSGGPYEEEYKREYTVDNNGRVTESIEYNWDGNAWEQYRRDVYEYDANGNEILTSYYSWSGSAWEEERRYTSSYNAYNQVVSDTTFWRGLGSLDPEDRTYYFYEEYEDGTNGITAIPTISSTVLPNPFTINVAIQFNVAEAGSHTFEVYNMAGQRIHTESRHWAPGQQTIVWDGNDAPKGMYFYKINSQSGVASGKLVKQ